MSKAVLKVGFYYGTENFEELIKKIICQNLSCYTLKGDNSDNLCLPKDDGADVICQRNVGPRGE